MADNFESESSDDVVENDDAEALQKSSDEALLERAREFIKTAQEATSDERNLALEDIEFSTGKQWPDNIKQDREMDGRPCLVINRMPQFIQQITNDQRQNRPSIKAHPVSDGADIETAKIISGLARHIEYNSNAEVAYDRACDSTVRGGFGFWRILTEYATPTSFDQEIFIRSIANPFSVDLDPCSREPDGSDANGGSISEWLNRDDFSRKYPGAEPISASGIEAIGDRSPQWFRDGSVRVVEYFYRDFVPVKIHQLATGETVKDEDLAARQAEALAAGIDARVVQSRISKEPKVSWIKLNGVEILDRGEWAGKFIPIVPVYGAEVYVGGKRILESLVRHLKDPQKMLNFWKTNEAETIALVPRAPFIGVEGQFEGHESKWQTANRRNHAYLEYKPTSISGQPAPPPQRSAIEPAVQAITMASRGAADDLEKIAGSPDETRGFGNPDMSGVALQKRNVQAQTANFHFTDNLNRAIRHTGKILVDLIPKIYDTARSSRIIGDDGTHKVVMLNQKHKDESGNEVLYDLDAGLYDVTIDTGPSFASKRQEAATSMQDVARSYPKVMDIAGDLFIKNMDWPGAQDIAERIKKTLPPGLADDPSASKIPPQVQAQMHQMGSVIDQLSKQLNIATQEIAMKRFELEHKERIELAKIQADIEINMLKEGNKSAIALLEQEIGSIKHRMELLHDAQPIGADLSAPGGDTALAPQPAGGPTPEPSGAQ